MTSDEATASEGGSGGPAHCPDAEVLANGTVRLRAERSGGGDGRVYRITVRATDSCGNFTECSATVSVPHNRHRPAVDSGQAFDATACN